MAASAVKLKTASGEVLSIEAAGGTATVQDLRAHVAGVLGVGVGDVQLFATLPLGVAELTDDKLALDAAVYGMETLDIKLRPLFGIGQRLEARDRMHPSLICVASVAEVDERRRVKIHFDGWANTYDYWAEADSKDIAPVGTCESMCYRLEPPHNLPFGSWEAYLASNGYSAAPDDCFARAADECFADGPHRPMLASGPSFGALLNLSPQHRARSSVEAQVFLRERRRSRSATSKAVPTSPQENPASISADRHFSDVVAYAAAAMLTGAGIGVQLASVVWLDNKEKKSAAQSVAAVFTFMGSAVAALNLGRRFLYPPNSV